MIVRGYRSEDRSAVRDIAWDTAFLGEPASAFFSDKEILTDFLTLYFTDYEPESCFVAEADSRVAGYLIGSRDCLDMASVFKKKILGKLLVRFILSGALGHGKTMNMVWRFFLSFLKGEFFMEEIRKDYPATLHINIRKGFRGKGTGAELIRTFEEYLRANRVSGVHLATMSPEAGGFFAKLGFSLLSRHHRSYFRHLGKDIYVSVYVKKLTG